MLVYAAARWSPSLRGLVVLLPFSKASFSKSGKLGEVFATNLKRIFLIAVNNASCKRIQLHQTFAWCNSTLDKARSLSESTRLPDC